VKALHGGSIQLRTVNAFKKVFVESLEKEGIIRNSVKIIQTI